MPCELSNPPPDLAVSLRDRLGAKVEGTIGVAASLGRFGGNQTIRGGRQGLRTGAQDVEALRTKTRSVRSDYRGRMKFKNWRKEALRDWDLEKSSPQVRV